MKLTVCQDTTCAATQTDRPKQPPLVLWRRVSMSQQASAQAPKARSLGLPFDGIRSPPSEGLRAVCVSSSSASIFSLNRVFFDCGASAPRNFSSAFSTESLKAKRSSDKYRQLSQTVPPRVDQFCSLAGAPHVRFRQVQTLVREGVRWLSCAILLSSHRPIPHHRKTRRSRYPRPDPHYDASEAALERVEGERPRQTQAHRNMVSCNARMQLVEDPKSPLIDNGTQSSGIGKPVICCTALLFIPASSTFLRTVKFGDPGDAIVPREKQATVSFSSSHRTTFPFDWRLIAMLGMRSQAAPNVRVLHLPHKRK